MENIPQINISEEAYSNLTTLLAKHSEYNCVRFSYMHSCCKSAQLDIILDEIKAADTFKAYKTLKLVFEKEVQDKIKEIELVYKDSSFMLKCTPYDNSKTGGCSSCSSKNSSCSGGCCR